MDSTMTEPEHVCETCRRGRIGLGGEWCCKVGETDRGWEIVGGCPDPHTCPAWERRE